MKRRDAVEEMDKLEKEGPDWTCCRVFLACVLLLLCCLRVVVVGMDKMIMVRSSLGLFGLCVLMPPGLQLLLQGAALVSGLAPRECRVAWKGIVLLASLPFRAIRFCLGVAARWCVAAAKLILATPRAIFNSLLFILKLSTQVLLLLFRGLVRVLQAICFVLALPFRCAYFVVRMTLMVLRNLFNLLVYISKLTIKALVLFFHGVTRLGKAICFVLSLPFKGAFYAGRAIFKTLFFILTLPYKALVMLYEGVSSATRFILQAGELCVKGLYFVVSLPFRAIYHIVCLPVRGIQFLFRMISSAVWTCTKPIAEMLFTIREAISDACSFFKTTIASVLSTFSFVLRVGYHITKGVYFVVSLPFLGLWKLRKFYFGENDLCECALCRAEGTLALYRRKEGCECDVGHFFCHRHFRDMVAATQGNGVVQCLECGNENATQFSEKVIFESAGADALSAVFKAREALLIREMHMRIQGARIEGERKGKEAALKEAAERQLSLMQIRVAQVLLKIESIALPQCPRCKVAVEHDSGCAAMRCGNCGCRFCMFCLTDCGHDAHSHVQTCPHKPNFGTITTAWGSPEESRAAMSRKIRQDLTIYWGTLDRDLRIAATKDTAIRSYLTLHGVG